MGAVAGGALYFFGHSRARYWYVFVIVLMAPRMVRAQISPGRLSRAHQDLDSPLKCGNCHSFGSEKPALRCLHCHEEIAERLRAKRGYHAIAMNGGTGEAACGRCHPEHGGVGFHLVDPNFAKTNFDHNRLGFALEGKHAALKCSGCHQPKFIPSFNRAGIKKTNLAETYLGLDSSCVSCHQDVHEGTLGGDCAKCHDFEQWKPASRFNHASTDYPLTGRHAAVACEKCHIPEPAKPVALKLRQMAFADCSSCHKDPHGGAFEARCSSCHSTAGWRQLSPSESFRHDKTKFPLRGKHASLACNACHKTTDFSAPVAHQRCMDCHQDAHRGQFEASAGGGDCGACHNETAFAPSTFTVQSHRRTAFPLNGKHAQVECAKCHPGARAERNFHPAYGRCLDCHKDAHQGQFAGTRWGNRCESCHTENAFRPANYGLAQHRESGFPLSGAHAAVACRDCHLGEAQAENEPWRFHFASRACDACHRDPHGFQTDLNGRQGRECDACHTTSGWKGTVPFDHDSTRFPLRGAHRTAGCMDCHKPKLQAAGIRAIVFADAPVACRACHEDPHGGQFHRPGQDPDCSVCHAPARWKPSLFDHERSGFKLAGAHLGVACRLCHQHTETWQGRQVLVYAKTPRRCAECHK